MSPNSVRGRSGGAAGVRILPYGNTAVLAEAETLEAILSLYAHLQQHRPAGIVDIVPAARTVLVTFDPGTTTPAAVRSWIDAAGRLSGGTAGIPSTDGIGGTAAELRIEVHYDGPDLSSTAELLGISAADLVELHAGSQWTAAFTGFAPGFAYLITDHDRLHVPRRNEPRTRVPPGAVGLAGEFSGIYPTSSPGGWQLIGSTRTVLWNPKAAQPALITPGTRVRFEPAD